LFIKVLLCSNPALKAFARDLSDGKVRREFAEFKGMPGGKRTPSDKQRDIRDKRDGNSRASP
jgi:hypothetical protein